MIEYFDRLASTISSTVRNDLADSAKSWIKEPGAIENLLCFVIGGFGLFVTGNNNLGMKTLDDTKCSRSICPTQPVPKCEHLVDSIVNDVAGHDGIERRDVERGTRRDIALTDLNHTHLVPFGL